MDASDVEVRPPESRVFLTRDHVKGKVLKLPEPVSKPVVEMENRGRWDEVSPYHYKATKAGIVLTEGSWPRKVRITGSWGQVKYVRKPVVDDA